MAIVLNIYPPAPNPPMIMPDMIPSYPGKYYHATFNAVRYPNADPTPRGPTNKTRNILNVLAYVDNRPPVMIIRPDIRIYMRGLIILFLRT